MNKLTKIALFLILSISFIGSLLLPEQATAAIFDPPHTDKSVEYLSMIFGSRVGSIQLSSESLNPVLGQLFQIFNGIILAVAIFILSYVAIVSTINTAQEGQVMGKKWSSVWIPLRSTIGLLLLAPTPGSGYSLLQITIMWIVLNGIGAADKIWNFVLNNLSQGISITQNTKINHAAIDMLENDELIANGINISKNLLNNLICMEIISNNPDNTPKEYIFEEDPITDEGTYPKKSATLKFGFEGRPGYAQDARTNICGTIKINASLSPDDLTSTNGPIILSSEQKIKIVQDAFEAKKQAILLMIPAISPIAKQIAQTPPNANGEQIILPDNIRKTQGILRRPVTIYQEYLNAKLTKQQTIGLIDREVASVPLISEDIIKQSKAFGWISAGSFYYLFSHQVIENLLKTALEKPNLGENADPFNNTNFDENRIRDASFPGINLSHFTPYKNTINNNSETITNLFREPLNTKNLISNYNQHNSSAYDHILKSPSPDSLNVISNETIKKNFIEPFNTSGLLQSLPESLKDLKKPLEEFSQSANAIIKNIQKLFSESHSDPLISQAIFGIKLMKITESFSSWVILTGFMPNLLEKVTTTNKDLTATLTFVIGVLPAFLVFIGIFWAIGASLAIYTPMVPYMMFIIASLSVMTLVMEAVVAAPIVALGFMTPSQDELGKIAPTLGILANIFLRPMLMIIGLIMGAKLYKATIYIVNFGFEFSFNALQAQTGSSLLSSVVIMILYCGFIITLVNKCYGLIYQLPDKILRYIGITGEPTDVSSIRETQQSFDQHSKDTVKPLEGAAASAANKLKDSFNKKNPEHTAVGAGEPSPKNPPADSTGSN